ncbi:ethanolamine utilization protein [Clostridium tetani]|uniref:Ethanolamine utilization protein n=1 Tax=Clostridium tetani TaxID=1513 RepID=A0A4Q0VDM2_CLOTA|nr:cupin domain-containing protein [Clostridium tetani]RXI49100.1 ethanolamine utilization protein [Clostridium tetani]RXI53759.1 ethanolamine utilization protein [Clostridium tetani]RXI54689.1 ethanolamine utilization protein [Clostridium tetani]RXM70408.1 ethanolamine utilization protein [Clostridium tetani]BDR70527.1 ethanolamine utilization protein [Clostridium tetani]
MENLNEKLIEEIVRKIITEKLGQTAPENTPDFEKNVDRSGVISIKTETVKPEKFDTGKEGDKVYLKDVVTLEESPRLGCGIMEMDKTSFAWTLKYDEVDYIIDGTLEIDIDGRKVVGNKGDIIYIPRDSSIHFTVPNYARFMYVTYPANWAEQE